MSYFYDAVLAENQDFSNTNGMRIVTCGYDYVQFIPQHHMRTRHDYYLVYIAYGNARYIRNGKTYDVKEGEMFMYEPNEKQDLYYSTDHQKTVIYFVHFIGDFAKELVNKIHISGGYIKPHNPNQILNFYIKIVNEYITKQKNYEENALGTLIEMLSLLSRDIYSESTDSFSNVLLYIHQNNDTTIDEWATACGYSTSHFITIFKQRFNKTPLQYKNELILNTAKKYLSTTNFTITEIAQLTGFTNNLLYFNKFFKSHTGLTPTEFRKQSVSLEHITARE